VSKRLIELLMHPAPNVKTPALRTVGNIVTGDDPQTQEILNCSALPCLLALLANNKKGIRKEACWTISNITAGNCQQIQQVIEANIIPPLVDILQNSEYDVQKEAAWAISNATSGGNDQQIKWLVLQGVIPPLCELFTCSNAKMIMVAMEGIENILRVGKKEANENGGVNKFALNVEECSGLDKLEALQKHENEEIYDKAISILKNYFESEEDENADITPEVTGNGQQFHFGTQNNNQNFAF
jgi:hypothetical protein